MNRVIKAASWMGVVVGFGLGNDGYGQGFLPQTPGTDLGQLSRQMAGALRGLVDDVSARGGPGAANPYLMRDCQELQRSTGDWYDQNRGTTDPYQLRRSYSGIDTSWHRLRGQLVSPGASNLAIEEEIRRVEQADAAMHQALNLNNYPQIFQGGQAAPTGLDETRRLAYTLAQRGEALASLVQATYSPFPNSGNLVNDAIEVARMADGFSDGITNNGANLPPIEQAQQVFNPLFQRSVALGMNLDRAQMPENLRNQWMAYATALNLVRDNLGVSNASQGFGPSPNGVGGYTYNPNPAPQVAQWADGLDRQVDELLANFGPTAGVVPEGREMLGDMERLRDEVRDFRRDAARGLDPGQLAYEFRDIDATWQRLARRVNRIGRGRTGPNIQRVQQIGETCEQIHRTLGMPGYPPVLQPYRD